MLIALDQTLDDDKLITLTRRKQYEDTIMKLHITTMTVTETELINSLAWLLPQESSRRGKVSHM